MKQDFSEMLALGMANTFKDKEFKQLFSIASEEEEQDSSDACCADDDLSLDANEAIDSETIKDLLEEPSPSLPEEPTPAFGEEHVLPLEEGEEKLFGHAFSAVNSLVKASAALDEIGLTKQATETLALASFISEAAKKKMKAKKVVKKPSSSSSSSKSKKDDKKDSKKDKKDSKDSKKYSKSKK